LSPGFRWRSIRATLAAPEPISVGLKRIRKALGVHIRQRGQNTHEWSTSNPHAQHISTLELINSEGRIDGPLGNIEGHFRVSRMLMRWEIEQAIRFGEDFLLGLLKKQVSELVGYTARFNELVEKSGTHAVTISGNTINMTASG
jgi:hypothetical protein